MSKNVTVVSLLWLLSFSRVLAAEAADECNAAMSDATSSNAYELWSGASSCGDVGDMARVSFLLLAGQIRGMTDMAVLDPASDEDQIKASELYGVLYYQAGGSGDEQILRDEDQTESLFSELRNWNPVLEESYDPGWSYKQNVDRTLYQKMIECQKEDRIAQLTRYAGLARNDKYFNAMIELRAFQVEHPGPTTVGTPAHSEMQAILGRMDAVASNAPLPSEQPPECDFAMEYKPDPDADFTQVFVGANGLGDRGANTFESSGDVLSSWLALALSTDELGQILSEVDFDRQILVSLTFGKRRNATGTIYLSNVKYNSIYESLQISGLIGVTVPECDIPYSESYPFVLGVAPRPEKVPEYPGMYLQNFGDGCKTIIEGSETINPD